MKLAADKLYYRLKQVDEDGHANYSKIISVALKESATTTKVYPNPGNGQFMLQLNNIPDKPVLLKIYDNAGRLIQQQRFQSQTHTVDLTGEAQGIYYLELQQAGNTKQDFKLLKD